VLSGVANEGGSDTERLHMSKRTNTCAGILLSAALIAGGGLTAPAASAEQAGIKVVEAQSEAPFVTRALIAQAIDEARSAGAVKREETQSDGSRTVIVDGGNGFELALNDTNPNARLAYGSDNRGAYIAFNSFDQGVIISGAGSLLAAGICALGPAACIVGSAAIILASQYITSHSKCPSPKSVRVYPVTKKTSRCV